MLNDKSKRKPLIEPLVLILKSRRVIIALCALLIGLLMIAVPQLEAVRGELLTLLITLSLAVIGGYSLEDAAYAARQRDASLPNMPPHEMPPHDVPPHEMRALIHEVVEALLEVQSD